jgi:hypothetical protein
MEEGSWEIVTLRALVAGVTAGTLAGALLGAAYVIVFLPGGSSFAGVLGLAVVGGIVLAVIGGITGALVGLTCAIPLALILAAGRHFLSRHVRFALAYAGVLGGLALASLTAAAHGFTVTGLFDDGRLVAAAFALGAAAGALNAKYVVTGKQCLAARCIRHRAG